MGAERKAGSFAAVRQEALVLLAWDSALRISEVLALDLAQVVEPGRMAVRATAYLKTEQAKGRAKGPQRWSSAGAFTITRAARTALLRYIRVARLRGWIAWPPETGQPLFVTIRGRGHGGHSRLSKRTVQHHWEQLQRRAGIPETYVFHELRHDALTRFGALCKDPFQTAAFGRCTLRTALRYVHSNPTVLRRVAEAAAR